MIFFYYDLKIHSQNGQKSFGEYFLEHLRRTRIMRRSRHHTLKYRGLGSIKDAMPIRERPAEAEDCAVPSHWEGDLLYGEANSQIATLVVCQTRYVILGKVARKDS